MRTPPYGQAGPLPDETRRPDVALDAFALYLDPFNDNETGLWFLTTPAGIRIDQSISGDGTDREPELGMPRLPWSDIRVVRLKVTHTFVPW